ncbi:MAG: 2TM domain-containing protein [Hyphomicrobium sp.]|jgi:hypothetical protein
MDDLFEHMVARDQDRAINGFYTHFLIFAAVMAVLAVLNAVSSDGFWMQWVLLGWGLGICLHSFLVFVRRPTRVREIRALRAARRARPAETLPEPPFQTPDSIP